MEYYEQIRNRPDCVCRPRPYYGPTAIEEIALLREEVSQLQVDNASLRSLVKSLILANEELQSVVRVRVKK